MRHNLRVIAAAIAAAAVTILVIALVSTTASATEMPPTLYYITPDADGIWQVFRQTLDGRGIQDQITRAEADVLTYGLSERSEEIAYISGGELWLQTIGADDAHPIGSIESERFISAPVFGVNDNYIAFTDSNVKVINRLTGETTQIVVATINDARDEYRIYRPEAFVADAGGTNVKLIMDLSFSVTNTSAAYNFDSSRLNELTDIPGTKLLPLSTGSALIYGSTGAMGEPALFVASDLDNLEDYTELVSYEDLTEHNLYADQAMELALGYVRIFGWTGRNINDTIESFYLDVDVTTGETGELQLITVSDDLPDSWLIGPLSPDGQLVLVYTKGNWKRTGAIYGNPILIDLMTGDKFEAPLPDTISMAVWR